MAVQKKTRAAKKSPARKPAKAASKTASKANANMTVQHSTLSNARPRHNGLSRKDILFRALVDSHFAGAPLTVGELQTIADKAAKAVGAEAANTENVIRKWRGRWLRCLTGNTQGMPEAQYSVPSASVNYVAEKYGKRKSAPAKTAVASIVELEKLRNAPKAPAAKSETKATKAKSAKTTKRVKLKK